MSEEVKLSLAIHLAIYLIPLFRHYFQKLSHSLPTPGKMHKRRLILTQQTYIVIITIQTDTTKLEQNTIIAK